MFDVMQGQSSPYTASGCPAVLPDQDGHLEKELPEYQDAKIQLEPRGPSRRQSGDVLMPVPSVASTTADTAGKDKLTHDNNVTLPAGHDMVDALPGGKTPPHQLERVNPHTLDPLHTRPHTTSGKEDDLLDTPSRPEVGHSEEKAAPLKVDMPGVGEGVTHTRVCNYTKDGVCDTHGQAEKIWKPKRSWKKGKNGLFSWKYSRVTDWKCTTRVGGPPQLQKPTFLILRDRQTDSARGRARDNSDVIHGEGKTKPNDVKAAM